MSETNDDIPEKGTADAVTYIEVDTARVVAAFRAAADAVARFIEVYDSFANAARETLEANGRIDSPNLHPDNPHEFDEEGYCIYCGITLKKLYNSTSLTKSDETTT